jgi:asparagine synthase (glutamine-hydrolysing)
MTGNYGGEVLRRVRPFKPVRPETDLYLPEVLKRVDDAAATYSRAATGHPVSFAVFRQAPWHHYGLLALEESQVSLRSPYLDNDLVRTAFRASASARDRDHACLRLIGHGNRALLGIPTDRGLRPDAARLHTTLSRQWQELTFKAEYAYDYGMPQWAARIDRRLTSFRPGRLFLGRHKFSHFRLWYRDRLANYVKGILLDSRTLSRPYLNRSVLESMVRDHTLGMRNYTSDIHRVLTLELIHRLFVDRPMINGTAADFSTQLRMPQTVNDGLTVG